MPHSRLSSAEIAGRGRALYERQIRERVEPRHRGQFLALDVESGAYEIDVSELAAVQRAQAKNPGAALYLLKVGSSAAHRIGSQAPSAQG